MSSTSGLYCVIAIRNDGTRVVLAVNLTKERAQAVIDALSPVSAFKAMEIQIEPIPHPASNPSGDAGAD